MKRIQGVLAGVLAIFSTGCLNQRDQEIKARAERDFLLLDHQLERERALDAERNSPAHRAKVTRQLNEQYGNMSKAVKDLKIP